MNDSAPPHDGAADAARPAPARAAASLALLRDRGAGEPAVLMGQRGGGASFMPSKVVFPGGALDAEDLARAATLNHDAVDPRLQRALEPEGDPGAAPIPAEPPILAQGLALAAVRETFEETGLRLGARVGASATVDAGESWRAFEQDGVQPALDGLGFFFRAITPPSLPKRFDARLFVAEAADLLEDPDDFSRASGELSRLAWIPLSEAAAYDLPFVTHLAIAELQALTAAAGGVSGVARVAARRPPPFMRHSLGPDGAFRSRIDPL